MPADRTWSIEQEISLFSLVCDFKPAGPSRAHNVTQILLRMNENIENDKFTEAQVWSKLQDFFDVEKVEDIETAAAGDAGKEDRSRATPRAKSRETTRESTIEQSATPETETTPAEHAGMKEDVEPKTAPAAGQVGETPEVYSSELSDVEGEETELDQLPEKAQPPPPIEQKRRGRPKKQDTKRVASKETPEKDTSNPRKRTRSIVKDGDDENIPKRRQSSSTRRKTRSGMTPEVETSKEAPKTENGDEGPVKSGNVGEDGDEGTREQENATTAEAEAKEEAEHESAGNEKEPKARRPRRQAVRRSTRKR